MARAGLLLLAACLVAGAASELVVEQADRTIDISSFVAQQQLDLTLRNDGKAPAASVLLCEPAGLLEHAAYYEAAVKGGAKLKWHAADVPSGAPAGTACREFTLAEPLAKGARVVLTGAAVFTHVLRPEPAEVAQKDPQRVVFQGVAQLLSPYKVEKQSLELVMSGGSEKATATEVAPTKVASGKVSYGPYTSAAPFASQPISVHYVNNAPFAQVTHLEREIELSPWGTAYFEERYSLRHAGAKVVGEWSRFDLVTRPAEAGRAAIPALAASLPPAAHSLYFRDAIGNISSSETRRSLEGVTVNMQPRYPLFGGWSTSFLFGWSMPLQEVVKQDRKTGRMVFSTTIGAAVRDLVIDELTVKVVLPEGASKPVVRSDLPLAREPEISHTYTYLDVVGRPVVVLRARNLVQELSLPFTIEYSHSSVGLLQKPVLLSGAFALVFAAAVALNRASGPAAKQHAS